MPPLLYVLLRYKEDERQLLAKAEREQQSKALQVNRYRTMRSRNINQVARARVSVANILTNSAPSKAQSLLIQC